LPKAEPAITSVIRAAAGTLDGTLVVALDGARHVTADTRVRWDAPSPASACRASKVDVAGTAELMMFFTAGHLLVVRAGC
jgi:hypothetical protein